MHLPVLWTCAFATLSLGAKKPNIVVILTDDQDVHMNSLEYMPILQKSVIDKGTLYGNHYCTVAICCPSRVSLWTGKAAHNTNVTDVFPPYGGYPKFVQVGLNEHWLPGWLQDLGYNTYYTGKLFNAHNVQNWNKPLVKGFNGSDFLLDPYTYDYYDAVMTRNGAQPKSYRGQYSPDVVANKAYDFLDEAISNDRPFFLGVAPIAPHSHMPATGGSDMPRYAPRHASLFEDYQIPRTTDFNPDVPSGVSWIKTMPQLNEKTIEYYDEFQRARLRSLQAVDEMVGNIVQTLEHHDLLDNTYVFYTTDNGYHIGQHRMHPGKECPYETDIHIPLAVRGPGVPVGKVTHAVSTHTDLTPTFLQLAGASNEARDALDGRPIPLSEEDFATTAPSGEHVNVEFWGRALGEGRAGGLPPTARNNTYKALRIIGNGCNLLYTVWCTGEKEYYDLQHDPYQMHNFLSGTIISPSPSSSSTNEAAAAADDDDVPAYPHLPADYTLGDRPFSQVLARLDALLMVLKSCRAQSCREPWRTLHPDGDVATLTHALDPKFDHFYHEQPSVRFSECRMGYLIDAEGPQHVRPWLAEDAGDEQEGRMRGGEGGGAGWLGQVQERFLYTGDYSLWT